MTALAYLPHPETNEPASYLLSASLDRNCVMAPIGYYKGSRDLIILFCVLLVGLLLMFLWRASLFFGESDLPDARVEV